MTPSIVVLNGDCAGSVFALPTAEFSIGRDEAADLSLADPVIALRWCGHRLAARRFARKKIGWFRSNLALAAAEALSRYADRSTLQGVR